MGSQTTLRLVTVLLLLLAGAELFACDLLSPSSCGIAGSRDGCNPDQPSSGDDCLCCCHHIVVSSSFLLDRADRLSSVPPLLEAQIPLSQPTSVYHPPRA